MYLESEVFLLLVIGLVIGHLLLILVGAWFVYRSDKSKLGALIAYFICSIISFLFLLSAIFGDKADPDRLFASTDSVRLVFFCLFWLAGICCLIRLIYVLCKKKS
jgi:hypothetical protein